MKNKILGILIVLSVFLIFTPTTKASTALKLGSQNSSVTTLQQLLINKGYLKTASPTGYFGSLTKSAVIAFQTANSLIADGVAGTITLNAINNSQTAVHAVVAPEFPDGCTSATGYSSTTGLPCSGTTTSSITVLSPNGGETFSSANPLTIPFSWTANYKIKTPYLALINSSSDFSNWRANTYKALSPNSSGGSDVLTVNSDMPNGQYRIMIYDADMANKSYDYSDNYFTITSSTDDGCLPGDKWSRTTGLPCNTSTPTISSVSGPQSLNVNQSGTWTVKATDPSGSNLSYSVDWGDTYSKACASGAICVTAMQSPQQTATFTHIYSTAGTYNPTFTVTNASGQSATSSLSVDVGGLKLAQPSIYMYGSSGNQNSDSSISVNVGDTFTISGTPKNLDGLSYYMGVGGQGGAWDYMPAGYYNAAFFFDQNFGDNNSCGNNELSVTGKWIWIMTCTAKVSGSSYFYTEIYTYGGAHRFIYKSNQVTVTIKSLTPISPSITVLSPNGGEPWVKGTTQTIKWQDNSTNVICPSGASCSAPAPKHFSIDLVPYNISQEATPAYTIVKDISSSTSSNAYSWNVGTALIGAVPQGKYYIDVCNNNLNTSTGICDRSDNYFTITSSPLPPICDYAAPPVDCNYIQGPNYNSTTHCGMVLSCLKSISLESLLPANALGAVNSATNDNNQNSPTNENINNTPVSSCTITMTLKKGMSNGEVKCLQEMLNTKGFKVLGTDGGKETNYFGPATLAALKAFQTSNNLTADGIFGTLSRGVLKK